MQDTPLVPEREQPTENDRNAEPESRPKARQSEPQQPESADAAEAADETASDPVLIDQRFSRHRAGDTVVLYDRLEQTTWVQADLDPADLV